MNELKEIVFWLRMNSKPKHDGYNAAKKYREKWNRLKFLITEEKS